VGAGKLIVTDRNASLESDQRWNSDKAANKQTNKQTTKPVTNSVAFSLQTNFTD
jgi:hypothetical protein